MIYYSFEGNTHYVAKLVEEETGADLMRIEAACEPPRTGLAKYLVGGRDALFNRKVKIKYPEVNLSEYEQLIIATPVWAGKYTPAVRSFLDENLFHGKRVYLIATSKSGSADKMLLSLEDALKGNNVVDTLSLREPLQNKEIEDDKIRNFCHRIING